MYIYILKHRLYCSNIYSVILITIKVNTVGAECLILCMICSDASTCAVQQQYMQLWYVFIVLINKNDASRIWK